MILLPFHPCLSSFSQIYSRQKNPLNALTKWNLLLCQKSHQLLQFARIQIVSNFVLYSSCAFLVTALCMRALASLRNSSQSSLLIQWRTFLAHRRKCHWHEMVRCHISSPSTFPTAFFVCPIFISHDQPRLPRIVGHFSPHVKCQGNFGEIS